MIMQIRQLEMLRSAVRHASFSGAAEELSLTQPAVSMQMKALAEEIGTPLFRIRGRRSVPTPAAETLAGYADRILRLSEDARDAARLGVRGATVLRIAASSTPGCVLPERIAAFQKREPATRVRLEVRNSRAVEAMLSSGQVDLGVIGGVRSDRSLESTHWCDDPLVIIAAPDHPLASRRQISATALGGETLLVREAGSATRATLEAAFARAREVLPKTQVLGDTEALKHAVAAGLGVACISPLSVASEVEAGRLRTLRVADLDLRRPLSILRRGDGSPAALRFLAFLRAKPPRPPRRRSVGR